MSDQKEKLMLENLISSKDVFVQCISLIKPNYFSPYFRGVVKFLLEYYENYRAIPSVKVIRAETDIELDYHPISKDECKFTCKELESFCQIAELKDAILTSSSEIIKPDVNMGKILERFKKAVALSLPKDLGIDIFNDIEDTLKSCVDTEQYLATSIKKFDNMLGGGLARKQLTLLSANSGGGKSIMLANLGAYYAKQGYHVLYLSLELPQPMIFLRLASIISGVSTRVWKQNIPEIAHKMGQVKDQGAGSYIVKRIPNGSSANDMRAYLKQYELEFGFLPDVLIVDYLDLMHPNEGIKDYSISQKDQKTSEQLYELLFEIDAIGLSASQQNRDAIRMNTPDQGVIAGGLAKVNAVDNYISIYMSPEMRLEGLMILYFLKTRSSDAVGNTLALKFNPNNLIISDTEKDIDINAIMIDKDRLKNNKEFRQKQKSKSKADEILNSIKNNNEEMIELNERKTIDKMMNSAIKEKDDFIDSNRSPLDDLLEDF